MVGGRANLFFKISGRRALQQAYRNRKADRLDRSWLIWAPGMVNSNNLHQSPPLDRRLTPARPDLAAATLTGRVEAARFVEGWRRRIVLGAAPLRRAPSDSASLDTEALFGESVTVYEEQGGWAWAQLERDGYVGYLPASALGAPTAPDHRLAVPRSFAYPGPSIKLPPVLALSLGARFAVSAREGDFAVNAEGLHVYFPHLAPLAAVAPDFVAVAERFLEVPYLWGGRTSQGIDCSGLAQTALSEAGISAPRDSDMQEAALGAPVAFDERLAGLGAAIWCSGKAMSESCATPRLCCTPTATRCASSASLCAPPGSEPRIRSPRSAGSDRTSPLGRATSIVAINALAAFVAFLRLDRQRGDRPGVKRRSEIGSPVSSQ